MLKNTPAGYKKEYPWLKEVDSLALANVQLNLEGALRKFFREPGVGFPHYKSKKHSRKSYTTNMVNGNICLLLSDIFHVLPAYIQAWQNRSPEIFSPVFSPLFGFHSRTAGWQNIFRTVPCSQSMISASIPPGSYGGVLFLPAASLAASGTCPADRYSHLPY